MDAAKARKLEEHVTLRIGSEALEVVTLKGREGLSTLFWFELTCRASGESPEPQTLLAEPAQITLQDGHGHATTLSGVVTEADRRVFDDGGAELVVVIRPEAFLLTLGRDSRVFSDMTVVDIVKKVLSRSKAKTRWEVRETYPTHVYCAQYREDDWLFVSRMLEEEGLYYWFDHEGGETTLVFSDDSKRAPDLAGGALIPYVVETGMHGEAEQIEALGTKAEAVSGRFTVGSFDPSKPLLKVNASEGSGAHEVYDAPGGGSESPAICQARARMRLEAAKAARSGAVGVSSSVRLTPGKVVLVSGHPLLDGRFLVTKAEYEVFQSRRFAKTVDRPYVCRFSVIREETLFRPQERSVVSEQAGLQSGQVIGAAGEEIFPDESGRVRVQLHWDREGQKDHAAGKWMRVAQRGTASSMLLPRVGWNVLTFMEEGTVDAPMVLSRLADGEHPPPYALPDNKTRVVFKTATSPGGGSFNEIYFEDQSGAQEMFMNASKDMNYIIQDTKSDGVSHNQERKIGVDQKVDIGKSRSETVVNDQKVSVKGNEELTIDGERQKDVGGNETDEIGGSRKVKVGSNHADAVKGSRKLTVGGSMIEKTTGNMQLRAADTTIEIKGSVMKKSDAIIGLSVANGAEQTIGGSKLEMAGGDMPLDIDETLDETIGAGLSMTAGGFFVDGADKTASWDAGASIAGSAPQIHIEAKDKIELKCGGSVITLTKTTFEIKALSYDLSDAPQLIALTQLVSHN